MVPPTQQTTAQQQEITDTQSLLGDISHKRISAFGKRLSLIKLDGEEFLIGVQIASLLKRETFNMYRSMKIKNIIIQRANPEQVDFLCKSNAVRTGTHSVTLIPYEAGLYFIADALARQKKSEVFPFSSSSASISSLSHSEKSKNSKSFSANQPKLHRRKAHPWDVHRSIKREELLLSGKNCPFADLDAPLDDLRARQLAITKLAEMNHHLQLASDSPKSKKSQKSAKSNNSFADPFSTLLIVAGSLDDFEVMEESSPSSSLNSSPSSSLASTPATSPIASPVYQSSPPSPTNDSNNLFTLLPNFNLGIFSNTQSPASNNSNSSSPFASIVRSF